MLTRMIGRTTSPRSSGTAAGPHLSSSGKGRKSSHHSSHVSRPSGLLCLAVDGNLVSDSLQGDIAVCDVGCAVVQCTMMRSKVHAVWLGLSSELASASCATTSGLAMSMFVRSRFDSLHVFEL